MKRTEKLYEGNIRKKYLLFAIPLILSSLLSQSYGIINSMMIGKFVGSEAFAATATTAQLIQFLDAVFFGYLTGVGIYISSLYGKDEHEKMLNVIKVNFIISGSFALLISIASNIFCDQIFDILNVGPDVYDAAKAYFTTHISGLIVFQFQWGFIYIFSGFGMTKMPFFASIFTGLNNILLNYIFLVKLNKGIEYSALASIISSSIVVCFYWFTFVRLFGVKAISPKGIRFVPSEIKKTFTYGLPSMLQQMTMYGSTALVSPLTNTCSTADLSGYSIAGKARAIITNVYSSSSKANTNFIAQAMGAKRIDKIKEGIRIGITQSLVMFAGALGFVMIIAPQFATLFLDPVKDAHSIKVAVNIVRTLFPLIVFNVLNNIFHGIFRAIGNGKLLVVSTLIYAVSYVIYANILFSVLPTEIRIYSVHLALGAAFITEVIFSTIMFFTGKWKSKEYKEMEANM